MITNPALDVDKVARIPAKWAWPVIFLLVPVMRSITGTAGTLLSVSIVLIALVGALGGGLIGRPAGTPRPVGGAWWLFAGACIGLSGLIAGTNSALMASFTIGVLAAGLLGFAPQVLVTIGHFHSFVLRRAWVGFCVGQGVSMVIALAQFLGASPFGLSTDETSGRVYGLAGHPNAYAIFAVSAALIHLSWMLNARSPFIALTNFGMLAANAISVVASGSLSALSAFGIGLVVYVLSLHLRLKVIVRLAVGAAALGALALVSGFWARVAAPLLGNRFVTVRGETDASSSIEIRERTYEFAWDHIGRDPVTGVGLDSTNQGTFDGRTEVHSVLLHAWYQGGFLGALALTVMFLALATLTLRLVWRGRSPRAAAVVAASG